MSWTPRHNLHNSAAKLDWVAWGNKKAMYEIYEWKNYNNRTQHDLTKVIKPNGWASKFVNLVGL